MPDDYFNQQQRQHAPRYAAGSDMDSITTGQEIRYSNGNGGGDFSGKTAFIVLVLISLAILLFVASIQREGQLENQQGEETAITGTVDGQLTDFFCSSDGSKATIQATVTNNTNKNIHHIELTLTVKDASGNTLAEKTVSHPNNIIPSEQITFTEVLDLPNEVKGTTIYASMNAKYKHSTN